MMPSPFHMTAGLSGSFYRPVGSTTIEMPSYKILLESIRRRQHEMMSACHANMTVPFSRTHNPVLYFKDTHYLSPTLALFVCHLRSFFRTLDRCVSLLIHLCNHSMRCMCVCLRVIVSARMCVCECVSHRVHVDVCAYVYACARACAG